MISDFSMGMIKVPLIFSENVSAALAEMLDLLITFIIIHSDIYISHTFRVLTSGDLTQPFHSPSVNCIEYKIE